MTLTASGAFANIRGMKLRSLVYAFWLFLAGFSLTGCPVQADDDAAVEPHSADEGRKSRKKKGKPARNEALGEKAAKPAVLAALENFKMHNAKVNKKAEYFIYLYSASWCGFCQECMPIAVEQYRKMRTGRKVELIVIGGDKTEKEALKYLKSYKLKTPGIMFDDLKATQFQGLPGCGFPGFPAISVVTKDGQMLKNVVGAAQVKEVLTHWKEYTVAR